MINCIKTYSGDCFTRKKKEVCRQMLQNIFGQTIALNIVLDDGTINKQTKVTEVRYLHNGILVDIIRTYQWYKHRMQSVS